MSIAPERSPSRAVGVWALVSAVLAPVWLFGGFYAAVLSMSDAASSALTVLANVAVFGWFVVPLAVIAALVLGIMAIVLKRGKPLGIAALVVLLVSAVGVVLYIAAALGALSQF